MTDHVSRADGHTDGELFVGRTPREAIAQVRAAFGPDAVILEQRHVDGRVEILASRDFPDTPPARSGRRSEPVDAPVRPAEDPAKQRLSELGFEPDFVARSGADPGGGAIDADGRQALPTLLRRAVACRALPVPLTGAYRFLGPPGAGKTTTIIKLLAERVLRYGNRGVLLVSTDDRRLAGCEQLALAGELLDVPYRECSEAELDDVLSEHRDKSLVLVDTAGISSGQTPPAPAAATDVLVVPAVWQAGALRRVLGVLGDLPCAGAVLTQADQADRLGPALSVLGERGLPLLWISRGPELPDDLERATPDLVAEVVLRGVDRSGMPTTFSYGASA